MIYYQLSYNDAKHILATTDEPRQIWNIGDKPPVNATALLGSVEWTYAALDAVGVARPPVINYETFPTMKRHFKRDTWQGRLVDLPQPFIGPLFIKPADTLKTWTGQVFESASDLPEAAHHALLDASTPVEFVDEFRCFFRRNDLQSSWHLEAAVAYPMIEAEARRIGANIIFPDHRLHRTTLVIDIGKFTITDLYDRTASGDPAVTEKWAIVEIGDMFAMGTYGADAEYLTCHKQWLREWLEACK